MKKFLTSAVFIIAFAVYGIHQFTNGSNTAQAIAMRTNPTLPPVQNYNTNSPAPKASTTILPSRVTTPATKPKNMGMYRNGTYTGSVADAYYGNVQVQAVISGGKITNVLFLQYPNDRSMSRYISSIAMPALTSEAIQAQNANVSTISGASDTSAAFQDSLSSALASAKN